MIIKSIYVGINELGLPSSYTYLFKKRSRFICNWIEREVLKKLKFKTETFDRIVVSLCREPRAEAFVNSEKVACVEIDFDRKRIDETAGACLATLQIALLKSGLEKCALSYSIPKAELFRGLDLFVEQGMRNEWLHQKKKFKEQGIVAELTCQMTQETFLLRLSVVRTGVIVFNAPILETEPDEIVFVSKFKDIEVADGNLIITAKLGRPLWSKPINNLSQ
jgi:hypothetical protein